MNLEETESLTHPMQLTRFPIQLLLSALSILDITLVGQCICALTDNAKVFLTGRTPLGNEQLLSTSATT